MFADKQGQYEHHANIKYMEHHRPVNIGCDESQNVGRCNIQQRKYGDESYEFNNQCI